MSREYSFTLTAPLAELAEVEELLVFTRQRYEGVRVSRKTDRGGSVRFYLSFVFSDARTDLAFQEWFEQSRMGRKWELFGPTPGRWGLL